MVRPWLRFHTPLIEPDMQISRIRFSDKTSRLHPRQVMPKRGQAYEPEVPSAEKRARLPNAPYSSQRDKWGREFNAEAIRVRDGPLRRRCTSRVPSKWHDLRYRSGGTCDRAQVENRVALR